jgi:hypothetical protein
VFGARAVMNMLLEIMLATSAVYNTYAPSLRAVPSSGREA